jgi:DNA-binding NtrC family response regulator
MNQARMAMVVDSDEDAISIVEQTLRASGYQVKTASRMNEAIALIEHDPPQIMFCEMKLADGNGIALECECRSRLPALRFVLMARQPSAETSIEAIRSGVNDVLFKPLTITSVTAALARILNGERRVHPTSGGPTSPVADMSDDYVSVALAGGLKQITKAVVQEALRRYDGNKSAVARALGIPRRSLYRLLDDR